MGGLVRLGEDCENLCRRARAEERASAPGIEWVIEAQGLPNLVHELVHALFHGQLADDHGFDYGQIPLDLARADHRRLVWEELACCVLSVCMCAAFEPDPEAFAQAWFTEQFEIQGIFHGLEHDLEQFRDRIDRASSEPIGRAELLATIAEARSRVAAALFEAALVSPASIPQCDVLAVWARYRASWTPTIALR
jgi:hypothetical protein